VEVDIKGYFDAIPHDRLLALVREHIADGRVLGLIEGFLKQGVMEGTELAKMVEEIPEGEPQGPPQGGVGSPLLANIYLDPLDWLMAGMGFEMVRYADDMVVLCSGQQAGLWESGSELRAVHGAGALGMRQLAAALGRESSLLLGWGGCGFVLWGRL
jgi:retron-type reverse transcriptase